MHPGFLFWPLRSDFALPARQRPPRAIFNNSQQWMAGVSRCPRSIHEPMQARRLLYGSHLRRRNPASGLRIRVGTFDSSRRCQGKSRGSGRVAQAAVFQTVHASSILATRPSFPPGMKPPRTVHPGLAGDGHVCEAAVRRRSRRLQGRILRGTVRSPGDPRPFKPKRRVRSPYRSPDAVGDKPKQPRHCALNAAIAGASPASPARLDGALT